MPLCTGQYGNLPNQYWLERLQRGRLHPEDLPLNLRVVGILLSRGRVRPCQSIKPEEADF